MHLTGNTILITGGTGGIGRALAEAFHRRDNTVIIAGRRQDMIAQIMAENPGMHGIGLDVQDCDSIGALTRKVEERFSNLNVLVNNAGISKPEDYFATPINGSVASSIIQTKLTSPVPCC